MTDKEQLLETLAKAKGGDRKAQMAILNQYEKLCHKLARKFAFTAPSFVHEDLVQEGRMGLLHAINTFDPDNGAAFMTWAYYNVRGMIAGAGRHDSKQPAYPVEINAADRKHNLEDPSQEIEVDQEIPEALIRSVIEQCCGGMNTKRANIVMDRFGLLGRKELRNCECAEKYNLSKFAVNSHTYSFKRKAREKFPQLESFI